MIEFASNLLTGPIPSSFVNMKLVQQMNLYENFLSGSIPDYFATFADLATVLCQSNELTGTLDGKFNAVLQTKLISIQLSNNQLSGTLPDELFRLPLLGSLQAVSNCFHGTLSSLVCNCENLESLALDGLHSASSCQTPMLPGLSSSYLVSNPVHGSVPSCVFTLPKLNTLHLSGNGLTGSLPGNIQISSALVDLSLSHNVLTGSIPVQFQERMWKNLDLSYNRLSGSLIANFSSVYPHAKQTIHGTTTNVSYNSSDISLTLENNRLSGKLPGSIRDFTTISVLGTNMFSCNLQQTNLPSHDTDRHTY